MVVKAHLTEEEARVLWTALQRVWVPVYGAEVWQSALYKLCLMGGGYCCRDCTKLGTHPSRLGGFLCDGHKAEEQKRLRHAQEKANGEAKDGSGTARDIATDEYGNPN